jgi:hypothetical protein
MPNFASQLGEAVGNAVEAEIKRIIQEVVQPYGLYVDVGGRRPGKRKGLKLLMVNDTGTEYQIDLAVENKAGDPFILVESKYIRYKKHNRDKASWTCVAHYKLRTTYPTIRKSIAILMGNWSEPSKRLMNSFGVEVVEIPFAAMVQVLGDAGIEFDWSEKDNLTPKRSWTKWAKLSSERKGAIAREILTGHAERIRSLIISAIESEEIQLENVDRVELLLKTSQNEYHLKKFSNVRDTIGYLLHLTTDLDNIKGKLK